MRMLFLLAAIAIFSSAMAQVFPAPTGEQTLPPVPEGYSSSVDDLPSRPGMARSLSPEDLRVAPDIASGLLVVVADPEDTLQGTAPMGRFGRGDHWTELEFRDDGESPDGTAADGQYVAWSPFADRGRMTMLEIRSAEDEVLYTDKRIPLPWDRELPVVSLLLLSNGGHIATVDTNDLDADSDQDITEDSSRGPSGLTDAVECTEELEASTPTMVQLVLLVLGLAILVGFTWILRGHRHAGLALDRAGEPASPPRPSLSAQCTWLLPDARLRRDYIVLLARLRSPGGRVLICPQRESRPVLREALRGLGSVTWPRQVHPATDQLIKLSDSLRGWGRGLVIVEGPDALQRFGEEEDPKAVLEDLAQSWPEDLDLLVLLIPGELPENPNLRMLSAEDLVDLGLDRTDPGDA